VSDHHRVLSGTGLVLIALGSVVFALGMVSWWLNVRQPISYAMALGGGLALAGIGLFASNREPSRGR
jgi:hypothetical protein